MQLSISALKALEELVVQTHLSPVGLTHGVQREVLEALRLALRSRRVLNSLDLAAYRKAEGLGDVTTLTNPMPAQGVRRPRGEAPRLLSPTLEDLGFA